MLLIAALAGAAIALYFGLFAPTQRPAVYEAALAQSGVTIIFYLALTTVREIWKEWSESQFTPVPSLEQIKERELFRIVDSWLGDNLAVPHLHVARAFLFGSILHDHYPTSDVDLLVVLQPNSNKRKAGNRLRNEIAPRFKDEFRHQLHLEFKTTNEFGGFLKRAGMSKEIILRPTKSWFTFLFLPQSDIPKVDDN